jgi:hypothetical protein
MVTTHTELLGAWKSAKARPLAIPLASRRAQDESSLAYEGREIPMTTEEMLNPRHTALLVQRIQRDFISPGGGCDVRGCRYDPKQVATILSRIKETIAAARTKNIPISSRGRAAFPETSHRPTLSVANERTPAARSRRSQWKAHQVRSSSTS